MKKIILILLVGLCLISTSKVHAGGPLVVKNGKAVTYGTRPFLYRYDLGTLGMFSNAATIQIIEDLYSSWEAVPTSNIQFQRDNPGSLTFDVNETNFESILNSQNLLGFSPVIFDTDGKLLDAFLGSGASNSVLGLSGPVTVSSGPLANQIAESQAIYNGRFADGVDSSSNPESSTETLKGTIIHETGHGIGLDHAQINVEAIKSGSTQEIRDSVPLMFPIAVNDLFLIRRDDASAVSSLYPTNLSGVGKIEGKVLRGDNKTVVLGANVIARNVNNTLLEAVSCVSDFLINNSGSFTLFAVPPGDYTLEIEPVDLSFTGGSGVGPYTKSKTDKSFQNPVPKGFYQGENLPITTDKNLAKIIKVTAGQTVSGINIIGATSISSTSSSSSSTGGQNTSTINEIEPNDSATSPQTVTIPVTISGNAANSDFGSIELGSDAGSMLTVSDLYRFTINSQDSINALLTIDNASAENDLDLVLLNETATQIIDVSSQEASSEELITKSLQPGTYLLGVGAFSGSSSYKLEITSLSGNSSGNTTSSGGTTSSSGGTTSGQAAVTIGGQDSIVLQPIGMNFLNLTANAFNFSSSARCKLFSSDPEIAKIKKPRSFTLRNKKSFRVNVPFKVARNLIISGDSATVTIGITCNNGTSDEVDILITPNADSANRKSERKTRNWINITRRSK